VFKEEVAKLLAEQRSMRRPDYQKAAVRLQDVEQEIEHIMDAIKMGILTPSTKQALEKAEAERAKLLRSVNGQQTRRDKVATFLPNAIGRFKALLDDLSNVTHLHVDKARSVLRELLGKEIILHPTADGVDRYLTAEVTGDYCGSRSVKIMVVEGRGLYRR
jgi:hypothetical protein